MVTIPAIDMVGTGRNIAELRQRAGLSVRELQAVFGFATPQAIYKWQHGTAMPTIDNLVVLAVLFQVHIDDILVLDIAGTEAEEECMAEYHYVYQPEYAKIKHAESEYAVSACAAACA